MDDLKFDYGALREFLQQERTQTEVMAHFGIAKHNMFTPIITNATGKMLIYESTDAKGRITYGLIPEGRK